MQATIKAHFNKQTKDSKKELVQFNVTGGDERNAILDQLCREVVDLEIEGIDITITAEFSKKSKDAKKTTLDFIVKGDASAAQTFEFYKRAGSDVTLEITKSTVTAEEFKQASKGVTGKINPDGTVDVDGNQMSIEDVENEGDKKEEDDLPPIG